MLGQYRILRVLGTGGMARVYEGVAVGEGRFQRRVALKRLLDSVSGVSFADEAYIASHLSHGNIVQVLDFGVLNGAEFLVMELVEGLDARVAAREGRRHERQLTAALALHIASEVALALDYAHTRVTESGALLGLVHRDVSPSNVLLSWSGETKLADFGIAFAVDRAERTRTGDVKGKLSYMAPEQALGRTVSQAVDIYALGSTLHALLTGAPPHAGAEGLLARARGEDLTLSSDLPDEVARLLHGWMALDPSDRPSAADAAAQAGALARRGLGRDGRAALRDWLSSLRPHIRLPEQPADELVGKTLGGEASRLGVSAGVKVETSSTSVTSRALDLPSVSGGPRKDRTLRIAAAVGVSVVTLLMGSMLGLDALGERRRAPVGHTEPPRTVRPRTENVSPPSSSRSSSGAGDSAAFVADREGATVPAALEPLPVAPTRPVDTQSAAPTRRPTARVRQASTSSALPSDSAMGNVRIVGCVGCVLRIDGASAGFVPWAGRLRAGGHIIEVSDGSGAHTRGIEVLPQHAAEPLVVRIP